MSRCWAGCCTSTGGAVVLADDRDENIAYAEAAAAAFRREIDAYIETHGLAAPAPEPDPADDPHPLPTAPPTLDLAEHRVGTVLWCTGYVPHTPWLTVPESHPGIQVIGRPWLTHRASGILHGMPVDAARLAQAMAGGGRMTPAAADR